MVLIFLIMLPSICSASNWITFGTSRQNGLTWQYDKDGVIYFQDRKFMGIQIPVKKRKFQRIWIRSSGDATERLYQVDLNCRDHTARIKDDGGKTLYSENSMDYLYDKPIPPDSVLDMLQKAVCK
ncbi:MAG TPA: hypothetical protein VMB78_11950 [Dissulfurispiraceae bacterium]|nr:hypothetical protein [Dissulfurispiraceae bacterium]